MKQLNNLDLADLNNFAYFTNVTVRYSDQDELGHINNCSYAAYVEAGRVQFLGGLLSPKKHPGIDFILARVTINYLREAHYPGTIKVGSRILALGTKSMTTGYGLFKNNICVATADSVNIYFELDSRKTIEIPRDIRAALETDPTQATRVDTSR